MWHMGNDNGWGWWMVMGWVWMVVFWGLIIWAVYAVVTRLSHTSNRQDSPHQPNQPTALEILEQRYARGELDTEQFEEMRRRLTSGRGPTSRVA